MSSPAPPAPAGPPGIAAGRRTSPLRIARATVSGGLAPGAFTASPGRLPVAVRGASERTADSVVRWADVHQARTGRAGARTLAHRRRQTLGTVLVAVAFAAPNHSTPRLVVVLALVLLALLAPIALLVAGGRPAATTRPGPAGGVGAR